MGHSAQPLRLGSRGCEGKDAYKSADLSSLGIFAFLLSLFQRRDLIKSSNPRLKLRACYALRQNNMAFRKADRAGRVTY